MLVWKYRVFTLEGGWRQTKEDIPDGSGIYHKWSNGQYDFILQCIPEKCYQESEIKKYQLVIKLTK